MNTEEKIIADMLHIHLGDISSKNELDTCLEQLISGQSLAIDTIVNAANPTLMGSNQGVDCAIHKAVDEILGYPGAFNEKICSELDSLSEKEATNNRIAARIRCPRGKAVMTKGYGFCDYIIHVVGSRYDGKDVSKSQSFKKQRRVFGTCSSSRIKTLESCYYEIINIVKKHPDIKNVAIPIVGSGEYKFPFELAMRIAIAGIGNALIDWKQKDPEAFSDKNEGLQNIVFFIFPNEYGEKEEAERLLKKYKEVFQKKSQVVISNSFQSQMQYINEIKKYDYQRGYFFIARSLRILLAYFRLIFIWTYVKDLFGKSNWQIRRGAVEGITAFKMLFPAIAWLLIRNCAVFQGSGSENFFAGVICFNLLDTVTYLIVLIVMADIQKPSANVIRSLILLAFNYLEMAFGMAYLYYLQYRNDGMIYREALKIGLVGGEEMAMVNSIFEYILFYANTALKFFFVTLVFGYLVGHMRQRKFKS